MKYGMTYFPVRLLPQERGAAPSSLISSQQLFSIT